MLKQLRAKRLNENDKETNKQQQKIAAKILRKMGNANQFQLKQKNT